MLAARESSFKPRSNRRFFLSFFISFFFFRAFSLYIHTYIHTLHKRGVATTTTLYVTAPYTLACIFFFLCIQLVYFYHSDYFSISKNFHRKLLTRIYPINNYPIFYRFILILSKRRLYDTHIPKQKFDSIRISVIRDIILSKKIILIKDVKNIHFA